MSLKTLQSAAGVTPDGQFGPNTFRASCKYLNISQKQGVHFFAQVAHETGMFKSFSENLNYSKQGLLAVFGKYFNEETASEYARNPEKIANRVYANRMGNGDEASGDGWKYRGRGALQLTGYNNYEAFAEYKQNTEIISNPDLVSDTFAFDSAVYFFTKNGLWSIAKLGFDIGVIKQLTRRINGGFNGLDHRVELTQKYQGYL